MKQQTARRPYRILDVISRDDEHHTTRPEMAPEGQRDGMLIAREPEDGDVITIPVRHVALRDGEQEVYKQDLKAELYITNSRVAFACAHYDKGASVAGETFWLGTGLGLTTATVSKAYHKIRSRGTILAGHIRYEWLSSVGARPKFLLIGSGLRFCCKTGIPGKARSLELEVWYKAPPQPDVLETATEVIRRAAAVKLGLKERAEDDPIKKILCQLADAKGLKQPTAVGGYTVVEMPSFFYIP